MKILVVLVITALVAVVLGLSVLWSGFVLSTLWGWFMVPYLNVPALAVLPAAGVSMVVRFLTYQINARDLVDDDLTSEQKTKKAVTQVAVGLFYPLFALFFGWVLKLFM